MESLTTAQTSSIEEALYRAYTVYAPSHSMSNDECYDRVYVKQLKDAFPNIEFIDWNIFTALDGIFQKLSKQVSSIIAKKYIDDNEVYDMYLQIKDGDNEESKDYDEDESMADIYEMFDDFSAHLEVLNHVVQVEPFDNHAENDDAYKEELFDHWKLIQSKCN